MPQLFGTLQYNKLTLQGGHFYAPCGYENAMPTENFFYSHTLWIPVWHAHDADRRHGDLQAPGQALGQRAVWTRVGTTSRR